MREYLKKDIQKPMQLFDVVFCKTTISDGTTGRIIAEKCKAVVMEILPNNMVKICRFGNYLDTYIVNTSSLTFFS